MRLVFDINVGYLNKIGFQRHKNQVNKSHEQVRLASERRGDYLRYYCLWVDGLPSLDRERERRLPSVFYVLGRLWDSSCSRLLLLVLTIYQVFFGSVYFL